MGWNSNRIIRIERFCWFKFFFFCFPFEELSQASILRDDSAVVEEHYTEDGLVIEVTCRARMADRYKEFLIDDKEDGPCS